MVVKRKEEVESVLAGILFGAGVPREHAQTIAEHLVKAEMMGFTSHGVQRLAQYMSDMKNGYIVADAEVTVSRETATTALLDAHWQFGQVAGMRGLKIAIERACAHGTGSVVIHRSRHFGRVGAYTEQAALENCLAIAACS